MYFQNFTVIKLPKAFAEFGTYNIFSFTDTITANANEYLKRTSENEE